MNSTLRRSVAVMILAAGCGAVFQSAPHAYAAAPSSTAGVVHTNGGVGGVFGPLSKVIADGGVGGVFGPLSKTAASGGVGGVFGPLSKTAASGGVGGVFGPLSKTAA